MPGTSIRGTRVPTSEYWLTGLAGDCPGAIPPLKPPLGVVGFMFQLAGIDTLKSFSPSSSPYVTDLPPPETTPLLTDSCPVETPKRVEARPSSTCAAEAA